MCIKGVTHVQMYVCEEVQSKTVTQCGPKMHL